MAATLLQVRHVPLYVQYNTSGITPAYREKSDCFMHASLVHTEFRYLTSHREVQKYQRTLFRFPTTCVISPRDSANTCPALMFFVPFFTHYTEYTAAPVPL